MKQLPLSSRSRSALAGENSALNVRERSSALATSRTASIRLPPETVASTISSASAKMPGWCGVSSRLKLDSQRDQRDQSRRTASLSITYSFSGGRDPYPLCECSAGRLGRSSLLSLLPPSAPAERPKQAGVATATQLERTPLPVTSAGTGATCGGNLRPYVVRVKTLPPHIVLIVPVRC